MVGFAFDREVSSCFFWGGGETKVFPKLNFVFVESALAPSGGAEWCFEISILSFLNFFYN